MVLLAILCSALASGLPLTDVRFDVAVSGPLADIEVTQTFHNPSRRFIDATYRFPLQDGAVVDRMEMRVDGYVIEGRIDEVEAAKQAYEEAVAAGKTAALTTAERWNLFQQRVGNIPPGSTIEVTLRVIQPVPRLDGAFELALPLADGGRFETDGVDGPSEDVRARVRVAVDSGVPIRSFGSPTHLAFSAPTGEGWLLTAADIPLERDLVVRWTLRVDEPQVGALHDGEHLLLVFEPPPQVDYAARRRRELVFVVDRRMPGGEWNAANGALQALVASLAPDDAVGVFGDGRPESIQPIAAGVGPAAASRLLVGGAQPDLAGALTRALTAPSDPGAQRYVVLVGDGRFDDAGAVLRAVADQAGDAKVHAIAVGPAANRFLLREVADLGGGTVHALRSAFDPDQARALLEALDRPVLSGVSLDWGDWGPMDMAPSRIPDVHLGRPIQVVVRTRNEEGGPIHVRGTIGAEAVDLRVLPRRVERGRAIASTWARQRIEALGRRQVLGGPPARDEGLPLALAYQILSPWTAFVAIDPREREIVADAYDDDAVEDERDDLPSEEEAPPRAEPTTIEAKRDSAPRPADPAREKERRGRELQSASRPSPPPPPPPPPAQKSAPAEPEPEMDWREISLDDEEHGLDVPMSSPVATGRTSSEGRGAHRGDRSGAPPELQVLQRSRSALPAVVVLASERPDETDWMVASAGRVRALGGATDGYGRASVDVELAGPVRRGVGVDLALGAERRAVFGGAWTQAPARAELLARLGYRHALSVVVDGGAQDIAAPSLSAFALTRGFANAELGWAFRGSELTFEVGRTALAGEPAISARRDFAGARWSQRIERGDAGVELGARARGTRFTSALDRTTAVLGAHVGARAGSRVFARGVAHLDAVWRDAVARPVLAPEAEIGLRPADIALVLGVGRAVDVSAPELVLPTRSVARAALRFGDVGDEPVEVELSTGWERATGPLSPEVGRLDQLPTAAAWARDAWVTELGVASRPGYGPRASLLVRHTHLLRADPGALASAFAAWTPGLLVAHRPLFASTELTLRKQTGRWATSGTLTGALASPIPGADRDRWWAGWQGLGQLGLREHVPVRRGDLSFGASIELRGGRPGDPDLMLADGWITPDRLGALGVFGTVEYRFP